MRDSQIDSSKAKGLAPAGAGLSAGRGFAVRYVLFPLLRRFISFDRALDHFVKEGKNNVTLAKRVDKNMLFERVLVPPLFGLEDNSRYYSMAMVLEHLLTVGKALELRIPTLSRGEKVKKEVKIADYKPYADISGDIVERYDSFIESFTKNILSDIGDIHLENRHEHPWFGMLNPKDWMVMGAIHQTVHRRQIDAILKRLSLS